MNSENSEKESQLIKLMQQGDHNAMKEIYLRYSPFLAGVVARYLPNQEDLRDVMQEAFVRIFRNIGSYQPREGASLKSWMRAIVVNEALRFLQNSLKRPSVDSVASLPDLPDIEPDTGPVPYETLLAFIQRLEPQHRMVLNLFVFEEKSHREIAQILGITENTSASHFFRAKKKLAKMINDYLKALI